MNILGLTMIGLAYVVILVSVVNMVVEWLSERERQRMGLGCWLYRIGVIWKP